MSTLLGLRPIGHLLVAGVAILLVMSPLVSAQLAPAPGVIPADGPATTEDTEDVAGDGVDAAGEAGSQTLPENPSPGLSDAVTDTPATAVASSGPPGIRFGDTTTQRLKVGIRIKAGGECRGIAASVPVPMDWPEQEVRIIDEDISSSVRGVDYRTLDGGVKQMLVTIPKLGAKDDAEAVLTLEIRRKVILPPERTDIYHVPRTATREIKRFLNDSPYIESRNSKIRLIAKEITKDKPNAWAQVEAIYDYVRENVKYRESELKGAIDTLRDKEGDCEAMTSLFVALCRAAKIPARMVWVTDHSYPEFYLQDDTDAGHWFPCQISGARAFGEMPETRAIIQKGDSYKLPESKERRRYVASQLTATAVRGGSPQIIEVMEYVAQ